MLLSTALDKLATGSITALIGIVMTFVMLGVLILFIFLLRYLMKELEVALSKKKSSNLSEIKSPEKAQADSSKVEGKQPIIEEPIDDETMVAIQSALQFYMQDSAEDGLPHDRVTIKSVKRI